MRIKIDNEGVATILVDEETDFSVGLKEKPARTLEDVEQGVDVMISAAGEPLAIEDRSGRVAAWLRDVRRIVEKVPRFLQKEREAAEAAKKGPDGKNDRDRA